MKSFVFGLLAFSLLAGAASGEDFTSGLTARLIETTRQALLRDPQKVVVDSSGEIDPILGAEIDVGKVVAQVLPSSVGVASCLGDESWKIGFYDPPTHLWIIAELDPRGIVSDTRLGVGQVRAAGQSAWWPHLIAEEGGAHPALQRATILQIAGFFRAFPFRDCRPLGAYQDTYFAGQAAAQIYGINEEWVDLPEQQKDAAMADLVAFLGQDRAAGWMPDLLIPTGGPTWFFLFRRPDLPGRVLLSAWTSRDDGLIYLESAEVVRFVPFGGEEAQDVVD